MVLPETIGRYRITGLAGRGAMGIVYVAFDPLVDRKAAIKVQGTEERGDEILMQHRQRLFFNEAQAAGALDHPNIVKVYDAGSVDDKCYIVMEYVENADSLRSYARPDNLLPIETIVQLMRECGDALHYAHERGITHRDIKPANIMLTQSKHAKLVDFGIAQRIKSDDCTVLLSNGLGTPRYISPEQFRDEQVTGQSDIYSLGVVFYELLSGQPLFAGNPLPTLVSAILHDIPPPIDSLRSEVPPALSRILQRCLEKSQTARYQSGAELVADLDRLAAGVGNRSLTLSHDEKLRKARGLKFFASLSDTDLAEVVKVSHWGSYQNGACIVDEGCSEASFYVLVSGEVSLRFNRREIATLGAGECFGEAGYLGEGPQSNAVLANGPVLVMEVARPLREWASLALQMRLTKVFQQVLIERITQLSRRLSSRLDKTVFGAAAG